MPFEGSLTDHPERIPDRLASICDSVQATSVRYEGLRPSAARVLLALWPGEWIPWLTHRASANARARIQRLGGEFAAGQPLRQSYERESLAYQFAGEEHWRRRRASRRTPRLGILGVASSPSWSAGSAGGGIDSGFVCDKRAHGFLSTDYVLLSSRHGGARDRHPPASSSRG